MGSNTKTGAPLQEFALHAAVVNTDITGNTNKLIAAVHDEAPTTRTDLPSQFLEQITTHPMFDNVSYAELSETGWYKIQHSFKNVNDKLSAVVSLISPTGVTVLSHDLGTGKPGINKTISENVGGSRYAWFTNVNDPGNLAIDNISRTTTTNEYTVGTDATAPVTIYLADGQTMTLGGATNGATATPVEVTLVSSSTSGAEVVIPAATQATSPDTTWDGTLMAPTVQPASSVIVDGQDVTPSLSIKVGAAVPLTFSKPVKVVLPGQAGKKAGYTDTANITRAITTVCGSDPVATLTGAVKDCYTNEGSDLVIWTTHLTTFFSYGQADITVPSVPNTSATKSHALFLF